MSSCHELEKHVTKEIRFLEHHFVPGLGAQKLLWKLKQANKNLKPSLPPSSPASLERSGGVCTPPQGGFMSKEKTCGIEAASWPCYWSPAEARQVLVALSVVSGSGLQKFRGVGRPWRGSRTKHGNHVWREQSPGEQQMCSSAPAGPPHPAPSPAAPRARWVESNSDPFNYLPKEEVQVLDGQRKRTEWDEGERCLRKINFEIHKASMSSFWKE